MNRKFSPKVKEVISTSRDEAKSLGHDYIGAEHLLLGIIGEKKSLAVRVLQSLDVDTTALRDSIVQSINHTKDDPIEDKFSDALPLNKQAEKVLKITTLEAKSLKNSEINLEHLLLSILRQKDTLASKILRQYDIDYEIYKAELEFVKHDRDFANDLYAETPTDPEEQFEEEEGQSGGKYSQRRGSSKSRTPVLDNFGRDITKLAEEDRLDPIIGRENEIERVSQILSRRKKNNPILIGEPGVGKTAIVEGLALRIVNKKVSRTLFNKRIVMLDLAALVAGNEIPWSIRRANEGHYE